MIKYLLIFLIPLFVSLHRSSLGDVQLFVLRNFLYYGLILFITAVANYLKDKKKKGEAEHIRTSLKKGLIAALFTVVFLYLFTGNRYLRMPFTGILGVINYPILVDCLVMLTGYSIITFFL
jgi:hypothetical protein